MANNKVIFGNTTIMDITDTTAEASDVANGQVFYNKSGVRTVGIGNYMPVISNPIANAVLIDDGNGNASDSNIGIIQVGKISSASLSGGITKVENNKNDLLQISNANEGVNVITKNSGTTLIDKILADKTYVDNAIPTIDQTYDSTSANAQSGVAVAGAISNKMDLVSNPVNNALVVSDSNGQVQITSTDIDQLLLDVEAGKEAFMLKDFNQQVNITIPHCNQDIANTSIPNMDIDLDVIDPTGELNQKYAIASLMKYEVYDATSGGNRLNCWSVCSFSMNSQRTLRLRMMCAGSTGKTARRIAGALLLKHR